MGGYIGSNIGTIANAAERKKTYSITTATTSLTGLAYTPTKVHVFHNGVRLVDGTDYTATNGTSITLTNAAQNGDEVVVISYPSFQTSDTVSAANGGTFVGNVAMSGTLDVTGVTTLSNDIDLNGNDLILDADGDSKIEASTDDTITVHTAGSERMRIDSSGNVGIGTSNPTGTPTTTLHINGTTNAGIHITDSASGATNSNGVYFSMDNPNLYIQNKEAGFTSFETSGIERMRITSGGYIEAASASQVRLTLGSEGTAGTNNANWIRGDGTNLGFNSASGGFQWEIGGSEKMRIDSSGHLLVGTTSTVTAGSEGIELRSDAGYIKTARNNTGATGHFLFYNPNGNVGSITTSGSSTSYNTSSDYRLKENVTDVTDGITRVKQLAPKRFNFIADADRTVDGFLAHEAQAVVPEAVTGTHNEVDDDGNAVMQGIDQSKLVPLLTAALQEAIAKIEALETQNTTQATQIADLITRVEALEGS